MTVTRDCWCGRPQFVDYSQHYFHCKSCDTLVARVFPDDDLADVKDQGEFYGRDYYLRHLPNDYGYPKLEERARADLPERALYWLRTLLKHKLPPSKLLDVGSGHGGFVALANWAGFQAMGLELSPWLVDYARETFGIPMLLGPVESQSIDLASLDVVSLMDVIEHLQEPERTIASVANALKLDGVILIQTPLFREYKSYRSLTEDNSRFLEQLKESEHLFLFSKKAMAELLSRVGFKTVIFESALFSHYDMFVVASRHPLPEIDPQASVARLVTTPEGRMVLAAFDLEDQATATMEKYVEAERDRADRLKIIQEQGEQLGRLEASLNELRYRYADLKKHFEASEQDRADRLEVIQDQGKRIGELEAVIDGITASRIYRILRWFRIWSWIEGIALNSHHSDS